MKRGQVVQNLSATPGTHRQDLLVLTETEEGPKVGHGPRSRDCRTSSYSRSERSRSERQSRSDRSHYHDSEQRFHRSSPHRERRSSRSRTDGKSRDSSDSEDDHRRTRTRGSDTSRSSTYSSLQKTQNHPLTPDPTGTQNPQIVLDHPSQTKNPSFKVRAISFKSWWLWIQQKELSWRRSSSQEIQCPLKIWD